MSQLVVRKLEPAVVRKLRQKAAADGISMEEEHRRILRNVLLDESLAPQKNLKDYLLSMPAGDADTDADFARPPAKVRPVKL